MMSFVAVLCGYLIFAVSAGLWFHFSGRPAHAVAPAAFMVGTIVYGMVFALLGGYVTARIAPNRPARHAAVLGGVITAIALLSIVAERSGAHWSQLAAICVMAPAAIFGGRLYKGRA